MDLFDWLAIFCLLLLLATALYGGWMLFEWPGRLARDHGRRNAPAIRACGWLGLVTAMLFWAIAMVWALLEPRRTGGPQA